MTSVGIFLELRARRVLHTFIVRLPKLRQVSLRAKISYSFVTGIF